MSSVSENYPAEIVQIMEEVKNKLHPWRLCTKGSHYKSGTTQIVKPKIKELNDFKLLPSIWKCVLSSSKKDLLYAEEIGVISSLFFPYLSGSPTADNLGSKKGELKDHYIIANKDRILDPTVNICAGIRWLFHKRTLLAKKLSKSPSWEEAIAEYKNYFKEYKKNPDYRGMGVFRDYYKRLLK